MKKAAKILFTVNAVTTIFIGILHTYAHYSDLVTQELESMMDHTILVTGQLVSAYKLWQGMSLMMGLLLIIVGLFCLLIISRIGKEEYPPIAASLIFMTMLCCVIYSGLNFFGPMQIYGGTGGMILQSICLMLSIRNK